MILQALCEYYDRKAALGEIAPLGFERKEIPFIIVIDKDGKFIDLKDTREEKNGKLVAKDYLVPRSVSRTGKNGWKTAFFLWDHYGFVLGYPDGDTEKDRKKRQELFDRCFLGPDYDLRKKELSIEGDRSAKLITQGNIGDFQRNAFITRYFSKQLSKEDIDNFLNAIGELEDSENRKKLEGNLNSLRKSIGNSEKQFGTFRKYINDLPEKIKADESIQAIIKFYNSNEFKKVFKNENWLECVKINRANLTFQLADSNSLILSKDTVRNYQFEKAALPEDVDSIKSLCIISGEQDYIERIHNKTPVTKKEPNGVLVSFQKGKGFDSYGKTQAYNAPVGKKAQSAYTTALNTLTKSEQNRVYIGDTTVLFWSDKDNVLEQKMSFVLTKRKDDPDQNVEVVKQLYESIQSGKLNTESNTRFFVLGLAPNSARISVRYWIQGTVAEFAGNIKQHFDDLEIVRSNKDSEYFALNTLLSNTALKYDLDNVAPNMAGQVTEAVLKGTPYPKTLFFAVVHRIRAEQHVTRIRAAIIKACINRFNRFHNKNEEEITVALDKTNMNPAYRLGRLFAVLERIQSKALNIETIRERYYGAFSSTPVTVYPQLMKLKNHHLAKLEKGLSVFYERIIGEIIDGLDGSGLIPRQFSLEEQGRFAVGYYHQRQDFYKKKEQNNNTETSRENEL